MNRAEFVATARGWIGTPFQHQGRLPGVALDCAGLAVCAAQSCGYTVQDLIGYSAIPHAGQFVAAIESHCTPVAVSDVQPGDLMIFAFGRDPQHLAIVTQADPVQIIHAWMNAGKVAENSFDDYWARRLRACYRLRGIA